MNRLSCQNLLPRRMSVLLLILLAFQFYGCAAEKAFRRGQDAVKRKDFDRAVGELMIAVNKKPDNPSYRSTFERARIAASQFHFEKAKQLTLSKNYEQAIIEYQYALNFDPTNQFIINELEEARNAYQKEVNKQQLTEIEQAKEQAKKNMQLFKVLGPEAETVIPSLRFRDDSLKHILDALGQLAGINIVYDSDFRDQEFSVSLDNIRFKDALSQILVANRLYYKPLDQSTILIIPDNPQKRRQYDEQVIQTFYLSNAELNDVLNMVRSVMQIQRIATNPQLNAITIRDTPDKVAIVQKIIEANDKARSEILLDIEILEVNRDQALTYGVDLSSYAVTQTLQINSTAGQIFGNQFGAIDAASWSFTIPSITYNALASDQRTKILAKPQIRASEGQQVTVRLGDRVPIPVTNVQIPGTGGTTPGTSVPISTTSFQLTDVGINIDLTPRVHHNREITLTMRFELTSITSPGVGNLPPTLGNRTVNTVIRLKDGETNLLAGLLRQDERKSLRGIPGIIHIPFLRELFASNDKSLQEKDVIFTITPHILRTPKVTEADLAPIWIGTEDDVRLKSAPPISVFERSDVNKQEQPFDQPQPGYGVPPEMQEPVYQPETTAPPAATTPPATTPPATTPPAATPPAGPAIHQPPPARPPATEPAQPPATTEEQKAHEPPVIPQQPAAATVPPSQAPSVVTPVTPAPEEPVEQGTESENPQTGPAESPSPGANATISFTTPNVNPKTNADVLIQINLQNATNAASISLFLNFDPSVMKIKDILQGPFVIPGAFAKSFDPARGVIQINATRTPGQIGSGVIATLVVNGLKPGAATINLNSAVVRDAGANPIPVTFLPYTIPFQ